MGRIGNFFRKVGKGIKKVGQGIWTGAKWVGNNVVRPVASLISHPGAQAILGSLGPIGQGIARVGRLVQDGINVYDEVRKPKPPAPGLGAPGPPVAKPA
jgi:hypothetical protein